MARNTGTKSEASGHLLTQLVSAWARSGRSFLTRPRGHQEPPATTSKSATSATPAGPAGVTAAQRAGQGQVMTRKHLLETCPQLWLRAGRKGRPGTDRQTQERPSSSELQLPPALHTHTPAQSHETGQPQQTLTRLITPLQKQTTHLNDATTAEVPQREYQATRRSPPSTSPQGEDPHSGRLTQLRPNSGSFSIPNATSQVSSADEFRRKLFLTQEIVPSGTALECGSRSLKI